MKITEELKGNRYFTGMKGQQIIYSDDFYPAMYEKIRAGMTYVEAYNASGFDTALLGVNRANNVGKRVMAAAKAGKLADPAKFDGSKPMDWEKVLQKSVYEQNAWLTARILYLEEVLEARQYVTLKIGGENYNFKSCKLNRFELVERFIEKHPEYNIQKCLFMFGVNSEGYYSWRSRKNERNKVAADNEENRIMEAIRQICRKAGYNPGKRQMQVYLKRDHGISAGLRRIKRIMNFMRIEPTLPKKDAYKNQVAYNHPMSCPDNKLKQNFFIGPRKVILTDITYIYYGPSRKLLYLCVFYDPFTREVLGFAVDKRMTVELVKKAYSGMMKKHGHELKNPDIYIHSDQGSQYLETSFKQLLSDDDFIRSVSRRGNSQDNAPMESFFGRMKSHIMNILALCPNSETAIRLVEGYMNAYNNEKYQYSLAGLTPTEFYFYCVSGVYPCDEYYGIKKNELLSVQDLIAARRKTADIKAAKRREAYAKKASSKNIVEKDLLKVRRRINALKRNTESEMRKLMVLQEEIQVALKFVKNATDDVLLQLTESHENWRKYPELNYIYKMDELF